MPSVALIPFLSICSDHPIYLPGAANRPPPFPPTGADRRGPRRPAAVRGPRARAARASRPPASGRRGSRRRDRDHHEKATGTETTAGCGQQRAGATRRLAERQPGEDRRGGERPCPATIPAAAPRAVSRVHQIPSRNSGQNVLAASANAQPTRIEMSTDSRDQREQRGQQRSRRARRAGSGAGGSPRSSGARARSRGQTSWLIVPASETSRPEEVDRKAANAPARDQRAEERADRPGPGRLGQPQHDVVGLAGDVELRRRAPARARRRTPGTGRRAPSRPSTRTVVSPGRVAVRVGVEAHEDVRQPHRAQERRDQQRVDEQRRALRRCRRPAATTAGRARR